MSKFSDAKIQIAPLDRSVEKKGRINLSDDYYNAIQQIPDPVIVFNKLAGKEFYAILPEQEVKQKIGEAIELSSLVESVKLSVDKNDCKRLLLPKTTREAFMDGVIMVGYNDHIEIWKNSDWIENRELGAQEIAQRLWNPTQNHAA